MPGMYLRERLLSVNSYQEIQSLPLIIRRLGDLGWNYCIQPAFLPYTFLFKEWPNIYQSNEVALEQQEIVGLQAQGIPVAQST